jgi:uncharacterized protein
MPPVPPIDTHAFTQRGETVDGRVPVAGLDRLASLLATHDGDLTWRLTGRSEGGVDADRQGFLHLRLDGVLRMRCVRCLAPVDVALAVGRDYHLVASEAQAEQADLDEDAFDLLVASRQLDLGALIEDEAILALPPVPRHLDCMPPPIPPDVGTAPERHHPFAALAALRDSDRPDPADRQVDRAGPAPGSGNPSQGSDMLSD